MLEQWDLSVYDRNGQLVLVVEVKGLFGQSPEWAIQFRRNILAHRILPNAPFMLFALPDKFYLWTSHDKNGKSVEPDYIIDADPILRPYLQQANLSAEEISSSSLELIVASWLDDLLYISQKNTDPSYAWLTDSGLYQAIAGGRLEYRVPA
jgi:hypothetical protein